MMVRYDDGHPRVCRERQRLQDTQPKSWIIQVRGGGRIKLQS